MTLNFWSFILYLPGAGMMWCCTLSEGFLHAGQTPYQITPLPCQGIFAGTHSSAQSLFPGFPLLSLLIMTLSDSCFGPGSQDWEVSLSCIIVLICHMIRVKLISSLTELLGWQYRWASQMLKAGPSLDVVLLVFATWKAIHAQEASWEHDAVGTRCCPLGARLC